MTDDYSTTDIAFAAYLRLKNIPFVGVKRDSKVGNRFHFIFQDNLGTLGQVYQDFLVGSCSVEPNSFHQTIRNLTTLVKGK